MQDSRNFKMYGKILKVFRTTRDGYINVITSEMTYRYEGWALVPNKVKRWLKNHMDYYKEVEYLAQYSYDD